jgi:electron transfer flavoprotein alpha/beta subunit
LNIYVCIKQVPATETKIKPNAAADGIDTTGITSSRVGAKCACSKAE